MPIFVNYFPWTKLEEITDKKWAIWGSLNDLFSITSENTFDITCLQFLFLFLFPLMNPKNFEIRKNTVLDFCCKELPKHIEGITTNSYNSNKIVEKVLKFLCSSFKRKKKGTETVSYKK